MSLTSDLMSLLFTSSRKNIFPLFSLSFLVLKFAFKCEFMWAWYMYVCVVCVYVLYECIRVW